MVKTFRHSGKLGDIIYSLPCIKELSDEAIVYIPENTHDDCRGLYSSIKSLMELQPFIKEVRQYPDVTQYNEPLKIPVDYDLDLARYQAMRGKINIVQRYLDTFALSGWHTPWIYNIPVSEGGYSIINWTGRHLNNKTGLGKVNWIKVINSIKGDKVFIGTRKEHDLFCNKFCFIPRLEVPDIKAMALYVAEAKAIYCNQSLVLTLAQALYKEYYLEVKHGKTNCLFYTENEHIL